MGEKVHNRVGSAVHSAVHSDVVALLLDGLHQCCERDIIIVVGFLDPRGSQGGSFD